MSRKILPVLSIFALLVAAFAARAGGDLKEFQARQEIAAQKLTKTVTDAIATSRKLEKSNPADAKAVLQDVLRQVRNTEDVEQDRRTKLERQLRERLTVVEDLVRQRRIIQDQASISERPRKPATQSSGGVSSVAKDFQDSARGALGVHQDMIKQREKGYLAAGSARDTVVIPGESGVYVPPSWFKKKKYGQQELTAKEVALLKSLNSVMAPNFDDLTLKQAIELLQDKTGLTIIVDAGSLQDAMVDYDSKVTFKAPSTSVRTIMKKVFGDLGLTYVVKEAAIQVMTPKKASEMVVIRTYPVDDLVMPDPQTMIQVTRMYGPMGVNVLKQNNAQQLINMIQQTIEPNSWSANGGPGTITYSPQTGTLIVRASSEIHYQLGGQSLLGK